MKCQFTLKAVRNILLVCVLLGGVASKDACAAETIDATFNNAETRLKKQPAQLAVFKAFQKRVYDQLRNFLDVNNKESYAVHLGYMEENIRILHADFAANPNFNAIRNLTVALHAELINLLALLKSYVGTRSHMKLGLALCRFDHLLPKAIVKECGGALRLTALLEHRMSC